MTLSYSALSKNYGHRGGSDIIKNYPENTLAVLERSLLEIEDKKPLQLHRNFKYLEFDVRETYDNELVVFHDDKIKRMIPFIKKNKDHFQRLLKDPSFISRFSKKKIRFKDLEVKKLTSEEIRGFTIYYKNIETKVPTLDEFLSHAIKWRLRKPVIVEVKNLFSDKARNDLIFKIKDFKENYIDKNSIILEKRFNRFQRREVTFLAFRKKFHNSFERMTNKKVWCDKIINSELGGVFEARKKASNLCLDK